MDKVVSQFLIFALIILALLFIIGGDHLTFRIFPLLTTYAPIHMIKNPIQINEEEDNVSIVINNKYENNPNVKLLGVTNPLNLKGTTTPGRSSNISPTVTTNFPRPMNNAAIPTITSSPGINSPSQNSFMPTPQNAPSAGGISPQTAPAFTPVSQGEVFVLPAATPGSSLPESQLSSSSNNAPFPQDTPFPQETPIPQDTPFPQDTPISQDTTFPTYAYETTSAPSLSSAYSSPYETTSAPSISSDYSSPYETTIASSLSSDYSSPYETTASSLSSDYSSPVTLSSYEVTTSTPTYAYETTAASSVSSAYSSPTTTESTAVTRSTYSPGSSSQVTTYSSDASSSRYTTYSSN